MEVDFKRLCRSGRPLCNACGAGCMPRCCDRYSSDPPPIHAKHLVRQRTRRALASEATIKDSESVAAPDVVPELGKATPETHTMISNRHEQASSTENSTKVWRVKNTHSASQE